MQFRIADTFTQSLGKLQPKEQKATKTTAFDLQLNPTNPAHKFHRVDRSKDPNFWSVRVNQDIRLIVHKTSSSLLLCYVDHHDDAYAWAERRRIETHPRTGAAQLVELRESVQEIETYAQSMATGFDFAEAVDDSRDVKPFKSLSSDKLLDIGVPEEWIADVQTATEDSFFDVAEHLPSESNEALLEFVSTGRLQPSFSAATVTSPSTVTDEAFSHPDAQRRFRVFSNLEELKTALDYPWEKWAVFLHPVQKAFVERDYNGPARISGSAGTGKTIVALHRTVLLARRYPDRKVLLTTFSRTLSNALRSKLKRLLANEPHVASRITIAPITGIAVELYERYIGRPHIIAENEIEGLLTAAANTVAPDEFSRQFLVAEWKHVVDAWNIKSWEQYRDVSRLGRKTRVGGRQREKLWNIFNLVRDSIVKKGKTTISCLYSDLSDELNDRDVLPFDHAIVDEAQDVSVAELRFLSVFGRQHQDSLFFAGDLGQRIFQQPFSWKSIGIDIRGRSHTLRVNYRTSHQIRKCADQLLPDELIDVDGNSERRKGTVSVFNGPAPRVEVFTSINDEIDGVADWIEKQVDEGVLLHEIGVFVRTVDQFERAKTAVAEAGFECCDLSEGAESMENKISVGTMHLAKGLEFRSVVVMACDDEVIPLQRRIENVTDMSDLDDVYETERHLLYVACTRARDSLFVSGTEPASEFLDDLLV